VFLAVLFVEGTRRPGYDPVYHTGSELELGERGWLQRASFLLMGTGVLAFAAGVHETLDTLLAAVLLGISDSGSSSQACSSRTRFAATRREPHPSPRLRRPEGTGPII
jgi:hypothetical protein